MALGQLGEVGRLLGVAQRRTPRKPRPYQHLQVHQSPWQLLVISNDRESETEFVGYLKRGHAPICGTVITEHAQSVCTSGQAKPQQDRHQQQLLTHQHSLQTSEEECPPPAVACGWPQ